MRVKFYYIAILSVSLLLSEENLKQARVNEILLCSEIRENDPHKIRSDYPIPQCYRSLS